MLSVYWNWQDILDEQFLNASDPTWLEMHCSSFAKTMWDELDYLTEQLLQLNYEEELYGLTECQEIEKAEYVSDYRVMLTKLLLFISECESRDVDCGYCQKGKGVTKKSYGFSGYGGNHPMPVSSTPVSTNFDYGFDDDVPF